jgi:hypothetical protein
VESKAPAEGDFQMASTLSSTKPKIQQQLTGAKLDRLLANPARRSFVQADLMSGRVQLAQLTSQQVLALSFAHEVRA